MKYDFLVIGGGIVGVSTAWQLQIRYPDKSILLLEKEARLAKHQTGHNSGVIHAGVYYQPGSLKARFCKEGVEKTLSFCREHRIPHERCGKLLVAASEIEFSRMQALWQRCRENNIDAEWIDANRLREMEPNVTGLGAIHVKTTGIVDYHLVCEKMADCFRNAGGHCELDQEVTGICEDDRKVEVTAGNKKFSTSFLIACGGLMADRLVRLHGLPSGFRIIPFRGEYYRLPDAKSGLIRRLIYPIPDPALPFLGIHITRMIDGTITVGPNAVLGWKREGYGKFNLAIDDVLDMVRFSGFWKVLRNNFTSGLVELKNSIFKQGYLQRVRRYCPQLGTGDLLPYPAGIRAQAVTADGELVHDFLFAESPRSLHVCNAPSPAATSAIPIGNYICDRVAEKSGTFIH